MERQAKKSAVTVWTETVAIRMTTKAAKRRHWSLRHRARHTSASMRSGWRYILAAPVELIPDAPHRLQQFRLGGVIFDLLAQQVDAQRRRIDDPAGAIRERAGQGATAPQHGLDAGHELAGAERFGQVVIGA